MEGNAYFDDHEHALVMGLLWGALQAGIGSVSTVGPRLLTVELESDGEGNGTNVFSVQSSLSAATYKLTLTVDND